MSEAITFETEQYPWWLILLGGILNIFIGILLLTNPLKTVAVLVLALGLYWLIQGIFILIGMFLDHTAWGWKLFMGILSILAGIVILRNPIAGTLIIPSLLVLLLGIQGLVVGILSLIMAFKGGGWGAGILGAISIFFGLILVLNFANLGTAAAFIWVVAIFAIAGGIVQIFQAFRQSTA